MSGHSPLPPQPPRLASVDAYRGFVMLLLMMEVLHLGGFAKHFPENTVAKILAAQTEHVNWFGCTLHDLIQPSFSFLVGVSMVFSLGRQREQQLSRWQSILRAAWRSLFLICWGVILRSMGEQHQRTNFTFEDTLSQIGLGYFFLYLIAQLRLRWWWAIFVVIVVGYWGAFVANPVPTAEFDYEAVGVRADWPFHLQGLGAHWNKNSNLAWKFDTWFLNVFPRDEPFRFNGGGYATLSFIPTLATMLLGLLAGEWLRCKESNGYKLLVLLVGGFIGLAIGRAASEFGICPIVKRIWTPSWVFWSGGWCLLMLAVFHALTAWTGYAGWTHPLRVIGANSILIYTLVEVPLRGFVLEQIEKHLPEGAFAAFGSEYAGFVAGLVWIGLMWLLLWWLDRKRVFIRV